VSHYHSLAHKLREGRHSCVPPTCEAQPVTIVSVATIVLVEPMSLIHENNRTSAEEASYIPLTIASTTSIMLRSGWAPLTFLCQLRSSMHFTARKFTAATLAALLSALASFEQGLHHLSHRHKPLAGCLSSRPETCQADGCCSHGQSTARPRQTGPLQTRDESQPRGQHDSENCAICRFLALPQFFEPPLELKSAAELVCEHIVEIPLSRTERIVTLVPIRGPPARKLLHAC